MSKINSALSRIIMLFAVALFTFSANAGTLIPITQVCGGYNRFFVVTQDKTVFATGDTTLSDMGGTYGSMGPYWLTQRTGLGSSQAVESGGNFVIVLDANGFCWSWGNDQLGALGNGSSDSTNKSTPVRVVGGDMNTAYLQYITGISASRGGNFALAVDANGRTFGWGDNSKDQLGRSNATPQYTYPILITTPTKIKAVATGMYTSYCVDVNGLLWSFGSNQYGLLGINSSSTFNISTPQQVTAITGQGALRHIKTVSSGWNHCLALEPLSDPNDPNVCGRVLAFGYNYYGQCGDGTSGNNKLLPVFVQAGEQDPNNPTSPLKNIVAVAAGLSHSIALDSAGNCWTWGDNSRFQLGTATSETGTSIAKSLTPVRVLGFKGNGYLRNIIAVAAGYNTCIAIDCNGMAWAWGYNTIGSVGLGNRLDLKLFPTPVPLYKSASTDIWNLTKGFSRSSIQTMVNDSNTEPNNVIVLGKGIYSEAVNLGSKKLTLTSVNPNDDITVAHTILSGNVLVSLTCTSSNGSAIKGVSLVPLGIVNNPNPSYAINCIGSNITIERCIATASSACIYAQQASAVNILCSTAYSSTKGIYCNSSSAMIKDCTVGPYITGYALYVYGSSYIDVNNCLIANNTGLSTPADAVFLDQNSSGTVSNCTILNNRNGVYVDHNSPVTVKNCAIQQNLNCGISATNTTGVDISNCLIEGPATAGGELVCFFTNAGGTVSNNIIRKSKSHGIRGYSNKALTIQNNWIVNNGVSSGKYGIYLDSSAASSTIINNTIANNSTGGIYRNGGSDPEIINCIIWSNGTNNLAGSFNRVSYSCIGGGYSGPHNINTSPSFSSNTDNYHIMPGSSCINMGDPNRSYAGQTDIDDENRVIDGIVDIGADEYYHNLADFNNDGIVNLADYAILAKAWQTNVGDMNYNSVCNIADGSTIDYKDLGTFASNWLWQAAWKSGAAMRYFSMSPPDDPNDPNSGLDEIDPNNLYFPVKEPQCSACQSVDLNFPPEPNDPNQGSGTPSLYLVYDGNMAPEPNEEVTVYVHTDVPLCSMEVYAAFTGDANITTAMSTADCSQYGWDAEYSSDPYIDPNGLVGIAGGKWGVNSNTTVGYFKFIYHSGQVNVALTTGSAAYDANSQQVIYSATPLIFGGENMQQSMMQNRSSFQLGRYSLNEQPVVDINALVNWAQQLWNNDPEIRASYSEADWNAFIESIKSSQ